MATIEELIDENTELKIQIADLQTKNVRLCSVEEAVKGIIHHVKTHESTPEDLRNAVVTFETVSALANVNPEPVEEPEVIE